MLLNAIRISRSKKYPSAVLRAIIVKNNRELRRRVSKQYNDVCPRSKMTAECTCAPSIRREASNVNLEWRRVSPEVVPR